MSFIDKLPYEWAVGIRYTRAGKRSARNSFISFISLISVSGIALGVAALIVVLSVMNGFQKEVTNRMLSVVAHIEVYNARGSMPDWQARMKQVLQNGAVRGAAPFAETSGMLMSDGVMKPAILRGVLPQEESKVSDVPGKIVEGKFDALRAGEMNIVLGIELARSLALKVGDKVTLATAPNGSTAGGTAPGALSAMAPRMVNFTVVGIFEAGHFEYDSGLAFVHMADAQALANLDAPVGLRLRIADLHDAPRVAQELGRTMSRDLVFVDWGKHNPTWFAAVQSQKKMMFIILVLIIAVAAFNLVATLAMTVTDKQADIAILRTLGSSPRSIMKIFMIQGALIGIAGTVAGVTGGVLLALNIDVIIPFIERVLAIQFLSKDIYFISALPSDLRWPDVFGIAGVAIGLAFVATLYPSFAASRVKPAEALRYE
ncbi:lipoprotein-releasing ABC transporter permease subunit [Massilia psychrophila]|uniref:Lipoprotein-releasing system transmembrane subunit LolC n=1 Tax=Massilia psychrophila TaxID=1603353 RepID=A0A2G8T441_9BURK|nr:lipoprotein-releasing ABC transporter permease subunit [Massilia psychrophila]PIL40825.1 lipoprotein-releasing system transmembrane subunit LolC [Massilia psychrophila]GGE73072.1 lipoprotein releasing system protein [Massilia psychrophila]